MTRPIADLNWIQENCDEVSQVGNWTHYYFHGTHNRWVDLSVNDREKLMSASLVEAPDEVDIDMDEVYYVDDFKHLLRMIGRKGNDRD